MAYVIECGKFTRIDAVWQKVVTNFFQKLQAIQIGPITEQI